MAPSAPSRSESDASGRVDCRKRFTDRKAAPAEEKTGTTESPLIYGNPAGYNPPGYNPYAPGLNPPGYNPPGMGVGVAYPGYGMGNGVGYPGLGTNLNGGWNMPGPY